jgi:hypothetical protein
MSAGDAVGNALRLLRADPPFAAWGDAYRSFDEAWAACAEPAWMLWWLDALGYEGGRALRAFAAACAERVRALAGGGACDEAIALAASVGAGAASAAELSVAYRAARRHIEALPGRADFCEAMAAASAAAAAAVRERPLEAARDASTQARRAVEWDFAGGRSASEEAAWQAGELRRCVGSDVAPLFARQRGGPRRRLAVL